MSTRRRLLQGAALAVVGTSLRAFSAASTVLDGPGAEGFGCAQADGEFPRLIRHYRGETRLEARPRRLAVLATGELDGALTLGYVPAASTTSGFPETLPGYLRQAFPQHRAALDALIGLGPRTEPDLDALRALRPDLILGTNAGAHGRLFDSLRSLGPTVLAGGDGANWRRDFLFLGETLGERGRALQVIRRYTERCADLRPRLAARLKGRQVSFGRLGPHGLDIYGRHSFVGMIATDLGLVRPEAQRFEQTLLPIPVERVSEMDGDWLFYSEIDYPEARTARQRLGERWAQLGAVRGGQAIRIDAEAWHANAGPTAANIVLDDLQRHLLG